MLVWQGHVGRYVVNGKGDRVWEPASVIVQKENKPTVGQWFYGTDAEGNRQEVLFARIYDNVNEAVEDHNRAKAQGSAVMVWDPEDRDWNLTSGMLPKKERAQGCGGCVHRLGR